MEQHAYAEGYTIGARAIAMIRINDLARELEVKSLDILNSLAALGISGFKTHSSSLEDWEAKKVRAHFENRPPNSPAKRRLPLTEALDLSKQVRVAAVQLYSSAATEPDEMTVAPAEHAPILSIDWTQSISEGGPGIRKSMLEASEEGAQTLVVPETFSFYTPGFLDFDHILQYFDWKPREKSVIIDLSRCSKSNFQALALLIQYAWHLTFNGYAVRFKYGTAYSGSTKMLSAMAAFQWREVLLTDGRDFSNSPARKTFALRRRSDVQSTINSARRAIRNYSIGFPEYMSYLISELLYNATEHGRRTALVEGCQVLVPSLFQYGLYPQIKRLSFLFSDLGVGVKRHLEQTYPPFSTHQEAIIYALRPNVSGTFAQQAQPYGTRDNAGMGLTYSSLMLKRLKGDMYIVSQNGVVHVSPEDVTSHQLKHSWPGTFVLINLNVGNTASLSLEELMAEIRHNAQQEMDGATRKDESERYVVSIFNYFGKYAEDKDAAISFRDRRFLPAIEEGKKIDLDFKDVETAPHSFLNALLSTPIQRLGMKAYQRIRIFNAPGLIHEIIDKVMEDNLPDIK
ncbi:hypothetical protein GCM10011586_00030 [Silvibacterium dinghuense]|nr:hypothetical protein GCM10011586_00030 [Silvibacterium dinghuense]